MMKHRKRFGLHRNHRLQERSQKIHAFVMRLSNALPILLCKPGNSGVSMMKTRNLELGFARLDEFEGRLCVPCNLISQQRIAGNYFRVVSRLGDGLLWYVLLALLPLWFGRDALLPTAHIALSALAGVVVYKVIKGSMMRERPFASHAGLQAAVPPLDRYSFPSGHTLQATLFLVMLSHYYPGIALALLPFGLSVAASRVILGLHYPSDVAVGALLGYVLAQSSLKLASLMLALS